MKAEREGKKLHDEFRDADKANHVGFYKQC